MIEAGDKPKVPKLRFPEFEGEWQQARLGKGIELISGQHLGPEEYTGKNPVGLPYFTGPTDFTNEISDVRKFTNIDRAGADHGDLLITVKGSGVGALWRLRLNRVAIGRQLMAIRSGSFSASFVSYQLEPLKAKLEALASGNMIPGLSRSDLLGLRLWWPNSNSEQHSVTASLAAVDERLEAFRRRREALQAYKKGMMQRLFSQELRFTRDDGTPFPDWQVKRLTEVAARVTEKNASDAVSFVLTNSAVEGIVSQQAYFDKDIANQENLGGYYVVQENDFVYNPRISVSAPVGPIKRSRFEIGVMSPLYTVFRFQGQNLEFFEQFFASSMWFKYLKIVANYGARHDRMAISTSDFMAMPLPYPHPDEQQKIADFLSALNAKIDAVARQIDAMQRFKKGLLQQMFV